jgi:PKD repeat protein
MHRASLISALVAGALLGTAGISHAQHMRITTDNPADDTRLKPSGTTLLTITLNTNHDRDGSLQTCNSHSAASCGAPASGNPLNLFSYQVYLSAASGTVSWGTFTPGTADFTALQPQVQDAHDVQFTFARPPGTSSQEGLNILGSIPVTVVSGSPSIAIARFPNIPLDPGSFGTSFGTNCDGSAIGNTYILGSSSDPCGALGGLPGDWFDADGAGSAVGNSAPMIAAPASASVAAGDPITLTANATDADASDVLTITQTGAPAFLAFSSSPSSSPASATLSGTPSAGDAAGSPYSIAWAVNDGAGGNANTTTALTVTRTDVPPVVTAPDSARGSETLAFNFGVGASDPDGDPITSLTAAPLPSGATFTLSAFNTAGLFEWTPALGQQGIYPVTITARSGSPELTASKTTVVLVGPRDRRPVVTAAPLSRTIDEGQALTHTATASDPDGDPITTFVASGTQNTALPPGLTYSVNPSNTLMTINWTPSFTQAGVYSIDLEATSTGFLGPQISLAVVLKITVRNANQPPALSAPLSLSVDEGTPLTFSVSATDGDGDHVALSAPSRPLGAGFIDHGDNTGTFDWTPGFGQAGSYTVTFAGNDGHGGVAAASTAISVLNVNRAPVSNPGGPYSGLTNVPVSFSGTGSSDPDGDPLTYAWNFGDGMNGTGVTPSHTYTSAGTFTVALTVQDNGTPPQSASASTTATIAAVIAPRAYVLNAYDTIKLNSGKPTWCAQLEPAGGNFTLTDVRLETLVLKYGTSQISADPRKTTLGTDKDGNGIAEISACFSKASLRTLFTDLPSGKTMVTLTLEADIQGGGKLIGSIAIEVQKSGSGSGLTASVAPNPLNPSTILSFTLSKPGYVKVRLYDLSGRLVKNLGDETYASAGYHELRIDGRGENGERLASGVYFYNIKTMEGAVSGRLTILK